MAIILSNKWTEFRLAIKIDCGLWSRKVDLAKCARCFFICSLDRKLCACNTHTHTHTGQKCSVKCAWMSENIISTQKHRKHFVFVYTHSRGLFRWVCLYVDRLRVQLALLHWQWWCCFVAHKINGNLMHLVATFHLAASDSPSPFTLTTKDFRRARSRLKDWFPFTNPSSSDTFFFFSFFCLKKVQTRTRMAFSHLGWN